METALSLLVLFLIVLAFTNEFFQGRLGVSPMPSLGKVRRRMVALIPPGARVIVELGSGWGGLARMTARAHPSATLTGYEYSPFPFIAARLLGWVFPRRNLHFRRQNFFGADLSGADVVLCYLSNPLMAALRDKFLRELPPGALIISSTFFIPDMPNKDIVTVDGWWKTKIFVYHMS